MSGGVKAHATVYRARGKASEYPCSSCARPATEWAFDDQEPTLIDPNSGQRYYPDPDRYRPLCHSCHRRLRT